MKSKYPEYPGSRVLGARLRVERERLRLSQLVMGAVGEVCMATQHKYERGQTAPDMKYLSRIGAAGVDLGWVMTGVRQTQEPNWPLIFSAFDYYDRWALTQYLQPSSDTRNRLVRGLFELFAEAGEIDRAGAEHYFSQVDPSQE